jgi:hypothetical protein
LARLRSRLEQRDRHLRAMGSRRPSAQVWPKGTPAAIARSVGVSECVPLRAPPPSRGAAECSRRRRRPICSRLCSACNVGRAHHTVHAKILWLNLSILA